MAYLNKVNQVFVVELIKSVYINELVFKSCTYFMVCWTETTTILRA